MENELLELNIELIEKAVNDIRDIQKEYHSNEEDLKECLEILVSEKWISKENEEFVKKMNKYIEKIETISSFYYQISNDLQKIKIEMEEQMKLKPSVHFE